MKYDIEEGFIVSGENDFLFRLMLIVMFYIGLAFTTKGIMTVNQARDSMSWQTTRGYIMSSGVVDVSNGEGTSYSSEVIYRYSIGDKEYTSDRIFFGPHAFSSRSLAKRNAATYPKGYVRVYYDPSNPHEAVLLPGASLRTFSLLIAGILLIVIPILIYLNLRRKSNPPANI